ncbi:MAG: protein phosphatase CheZ [Syntrophobacterales bacterium]|nr:protein phosphatase CheZ [Syntrophobacterales bacterium]
MERLKEIFKSLEEGFSTSSSSLSKADILNQLDMLSLVSLDLGFSVLSSLSFSVKNFIQDMPWDDASSAEIKQLLQFAFATLRERIESNGGVPTPEHISEFFELVGISVAEDLSEENNTKEELSKIEAILESPSEVEKPNFVNLQLFVERIGGEVITQNNENGFFSIRFPIKDATVSYLERLFALSDPDEEIFGKDVFGDPKLFWLVGKIKEFMFAFSQGDIQKAKNVLSELAEAQTEKGGLYEEIGRLARQLHDSLRNLSKSIDPQLREFAEEKLPDSGDRLEHILKLTEHAANTTLDHVELIQNRKTEEDEMISKIQTIASLLYPLGDNARAKLDEIIKLSENLRLRLNADQEDLLKIMTAQDFQDLTGQIIIKIIRLLKDLEISLINLITSFGIPVSGRKGEKKGPKEFLYGPAHDKKEALKSQEDVDALLAEFGF